MLGKERFHIVFLIIPPAGRAKKQTRAQKRPRRLAQRLCVRWHAHLGEINPFGKQMREPRVES